MQATAVTDAPAATPRTRPDVPPVAWLPVWLVAGAIGLLLSLTSGRYGFFGDELYYRAAGRHLSGGLADQPPLVPLVARAMEFLFSDWVPGLRLPVILLVVTGSVLTALIARELGGGRTAQLLAIGTYAVSPFFLYGAGHTLSTQSFDSFFWTLVCWLLVRWARTRQHRLLLFAGLATAIGVQAKVLLPTFWVLAGIGALLFGPRDLLRRKELWIGAAIAVVGLIPYVWWQIGNGWPQLEMTDVVAKEIAVEGNGPKTFFPIVFHAVAGVLGAILLLVGVVRLCNAPTLRTYRFLGFAAAAAMLLFWWNDGRPFYTAGVFALCWAAAAVEIERRFDGRRIRWIAAPIYLFSAWLAVVNLPIYPIDHYANRPYVPTNMHLEEFGWPQLTDAVERAYQQVPPEDRANTVLMAGHYWLAGALDEYGPRRGLPKVYSPHRGYWYVGGAPPDSATTVIVVGMPEDRISSFFLSARKVATVDNGHNVNNGEQGMPVWLCRGPVRPWSEMWPKERTMLN